MPSDTAVPPGDQPSVPFAQALEMLPRLCASMVGVVAVVAGLWLALDLFGAIYRGLNSPEHFRPLIKEWSDVLGGDKLTVKVADQSYPLASLAAAMVLGAGCFLLTWLSLGVMLTGAKIISWTSSDREAIRRILQYALGPGRTRQ